MKASKEAPKLLTYQRIRFKEMKASKVPKNMITYECKRFKGSKGQESVQQVADLPGENSKTESAMPGVRAVVTELPPASQVSSGPQYKRSKGRVDPVKASSSALTCWTDGVRRSNRIRITPLEYWKGERFIRGRVHEIQTASCVQENQASKEAPKMLTYQRKRSKGRVGPVKASSSAAGTCWTDGVRRSNRIRTRPLEYWKGERFICGRVHEIQTASCVQENQASKEAPKMLTYQRKRSKGRVGPVKASSSAALTCWTDGVRRSNRIRTRPLEYWKGERFIRGRVHESLDTVIGIKCISTPSPGGKVRRFKVTSYMPEQKELVESIALH